LLDGFSGTSLLDALASTNAAGISTWTISIPPGASGSLGGLQTLVGDPTSPAGYRLTAATALTFDALDLYVSPMGAPGNAGTTGNAPLDSLAAAWSLALAQPGTSTHIHVASGIYAQAPFLSGAQSPITVTGGLDPVTWTPQPGVRSTFAVGTGAVHVNYCVGLSISGLEFQASNNPNPNGHSIAFVASHSTVVLTNCGFIAGNGGPGSQGAAASAGSAGANGSPGANGGLLVGTGVGGAGGAGAVPGLNGGTGGSSTTGNGGPGQPGLGLPGASCGGPGGPGGAGGWPCNTGGSAASGSPGQPGALCLGTGANGAGGVPNNPVAFATYAALSSSFGQDGAWGASGGGGGGGGAGGGRGGSGLTCFAHVGGGGGGGGGGGAGGGSSGGGGGGGSSIGAVVYGDTSPLTFVQFEYCDFQTANGGPGGAGGNGAVGGAGGQGGPGGSPFGGAGAGASGGNGQAGTASGGGGGGAGGSSCGIRRNTPSGYPLGVALHAFCTFAIGTPGPGGAGGLHGSGGSAGGTGAIGLAGNMVPP
jgi:hypothetical protein